MQTYEQAVKKIVSFWSDKSFKAPLNQNNGDDSKTGGLTFLLMNMASDKAKDSITDDKILLFENKLSELLMSKEGMHPNQTTLDVDYHPCSMLSEASKFAGIDTSCLPIKTWSIIVAGNVAKASYQYRGEIVVL